MTTANMGFLFWVGQNEGAKSKKPEALKIVRKR